MIRNLKTSSHRIMSEVVEIKRENDNVVLKCITRDIRTVRYFYLCFEKYRRLACAMTPEPNLLLMAIQEAYLLEFTKIADGYF